MEFLFPGSKTWEHLPYIYLLQMQGTYAVQAKGKNLQGGGTVTSPTIYITVKDELEILFPKTGAEVRALQWYLAS